MVRSLDFSIPENVKYPEPWPRHQVRFGENCWILKHLLTDGVTFAPTRQVTMAGNGQGKGGGGGRGRRAGGEKAGKEEGGKYGQ